MYVTHLEKLTLSAFGLRRNKQVGLRRDKQVAITIKNF
jgi:hypothetical protein